MGSVPFQKPLVFLLPSLNKHLHPSDLEVFAFKDCSSHYLESFQWGQACGIRRDWSRSAWCLL